MTQRSGGRLAGLREIWPAADGDVSFGLRGGPTRIRNLRACAAWMRRAARRRTGCADYDWDALQPQHARRRRDRAARAGLRRLLRQAQPPRALRRRAGAPHPAGALQRRRRDPGPRAAALACAVRARRARRRRRLSSCRTSSRRRRPRDPHPAARAAPGRAPGRGACASGRSAAAQAPVRKPQRARCAGARARWRECACSSSARVRRARSPPATSSSTAPR